MATIYTEEFPIDTLQVTNHIKFANLRAGINDAKATQRQFDKAQRDGGAAWRGARPPRNFRPRVARFAYPPRGVSAADAASLMDERVLYQAGGGKVRLGARETSEGTRVVNQAARHLFDMGFRFYRTLGWGGEGVAALLYLVDGSPSGKRVVAKMALNERSGGFRNERGISKRFKGQYHLLQRQFGEDLVPGNPQLAAEINQALEVAESRMMMFEFAEFGSLGALLKKVSDPVKGPGDPYGLHADRGQPLPDRALMHVLQCLATACEHMKAPAQAPDFLNGMLPVPPSRPVIHLDLEPSNMLFGGFEAVIQEEHKMMPILKVADLGLASVMPDSLVDAESARWLWDQRWRSKTRHYLPEQFSEDWDYCVQNPVAENIDTYGQVAGHFGPASNVYHIGLTLWCCITGIWPPLPTYSRLTESPVPRMDGIPWWTWWAEILDDSKYGGVDREIRQTVLACLAEEPRRRIDSSALLQWCNTKIAQLRLQAGSSDMDLFNWATANMSAPPEPPPGTPLPNFDPSNPNNDQIEPFEPQWCL